MSATAWNDLAAAMPHRCFALIDGAQFDDLPGALAAAGLRARGLYLEGPDRSAVAAGPFLAPADTPHTRSAISALVAGRPAAVLWSWQQGETALYRHLRGVTMISIPNDQPVSGETHEPVLFRIADPRAIALVLPVLSAPQLARMLGSATQIGLIDEAGLPRLIARPEGVEPLSGPIKLDRDQFAMVRQGFDARFRAQLIAELSPQLPLPCDRAAALVGQAFDRAATYAISDMDDVRDFVALYIAVGPGLDDDPRLASMREELAALHHPPALRLFYARQEWSELNRRRA